MYRQSPLYASIDKLTREHLRAVRELLKEFGADKELISFGASCKIYKLSRSLICAEEEMPIDQVPQWTQWINAALHFVSTQRVEGSDEITQERKYQAMRRLYVLKVSTWLLDDRKALFLQSYIYTVELLIHLPWGPVYEWLTRQIENIESNAKSDFDREHIVKPHRGETP